jgi:hypothetical protein
MKKLKYLILGGVALLVVARLLAPSLILKKLNQALATLDGPFCGELADLDLALIRGAYRLEGLEMRRWAPDRSRCQEKILHVKSTDISLSWSQLFRGKARLKVDAESPEVMVNSLIDALSGGKQSRQAAKEGAQESWDALIPWRIDALRIRGGKAVYQLFGDGGITAPLENIEGEATGIETGSSSGQPILFRAKADVFGDSPLLVAGSVALGDTTRWDADFSVRDLNLQKTNPFLYNRLPMTFTTGRLSVFGEAAGKGAKLEGYTRLLFSEIDVVSSKEKWKNFGQGVIELVSSLFFAVAENTKRDNVATELVFRTEKGTMNIDWAGALARALEHSGGKPVPAGIDNRLELPAK